MRSGQWEIVLPNFQGEEGSSIPFDKNDISLSTDIIVGFPGETEEEFQETLIGEEI